MVALAAALGLVATGGLPASAAGPKRIFITKYDENFMGHAGVTFELYQDTDGDGVRDPGEPLLQTKVTDSAGNATFDPVDPGTYVVHEVTPAGYAENPDKEVEIPNAKGRGPTIVFSNTPLSDNHRVNDPTGDTSVGDGTHVFDFGPSVAVACLEEEGQGLRPAGVPGDPCQDPQVLVAWNHSAGFGSSGGVSGVTTAFSPDGGTTWGDHTKVPTGGANTFVLGEPSAVYDPVEGRWVVAVDAVTNTGSGIQFPILVSTSGGPFGFWNTPVNITPDLPLEPAVAHGPSVEVNPANGNIYVTFIRSNADGSSDAMVATSTDGGGTFGPPVRIGDGGMHLDFIDSAVGPNGRLNVVAGEYTLADTYTALYNSSADPTVLWGDYFVIGDGIPRSGTSGACTGSGARTLFGHTVALDTPKIAVSPLNSKRVYVAFPQQGDAGDESDVMVSQSTDGGRTWSQPVPVQSASGAVQFAPSIAVTPDGRLGVTYFESDFDATAYGVEMVFYNAVTGGVEFGPVLPVNEAPSPFWNTDPSFDTNYSNCFGLPPLGSIAPGSGFVVAWSDGRDPGPAGNNGVDPNIYLARTEGPPLSTTLEASADRTASKIKVSGSLTPRPVPGARVTVTLFRNTGDGFEQIGRKRPTTSEKNGSWATSFARPDDGKCRVVVEFGGAEGRAPAVPVTTTFAC